MFLLIQLGKAIFTYETTYNALSHILRTLLSVEVEVAGADNTTCLPLLEGICLLKLDLGLEDGNRM